MKTNTLHLAAMLSITAAAPVLPAADAPAPVREEKRELRVISGPDRESRIFLRDGERREKTEMEKVAFLGVETSPVAPTLSAQLGLARGTGLVVGHVAPKSPAAGVLQEHDILLQLDDQILIETRQLAVLVRNHKEGDEVTVTYLRGGKKATARVKLGIHEVPKFSLGTTPHIEVFGLHGGPGAQWTERALPGGQVGREEVDRVLSLLRRAPAAPGAPSAPTPPPPSGRMQIERRVAPGVRAITVHPGNSSLSFNDQEGSMELTLRDGAKTLVAKDAAGKEIFSGPVSTAEQRQALPEALRERLERLEGMREMTFKTDGDFQGAETRVIRPQGKSISVREVPAPAARVSDPL